MKLMKILMACLCIGSLNANEINLDFQAKHHHHQEVSRSFRVGATVEIQQRFYQFQDATSHVKNVAHSSNPDDLEDALDRFISFMDPDYKAYDIFTSSNFSFPTLADLRTAYAGFGAFFNGFSQHFSTNCVVDVINCNRAHMTSGGGEWASLNFFQPVFEQITISNFELTWVWLDNGPTGPNWYIHRYTEIGNRQYPLCPPCGPLVVSYARVFPGSVPVDTVPSCLSCGIDDVTPQ